MRSVKRKIDVTEQNGIFRVSADLEQNFKLVPSPGGTLQLAFWDENRLKVFLKNFGFSAVIHHGMN